VTVLGAKQRQNLIVIGKRNRGFSH
jgi:hypothetical protein